MVCVDPIFRRMDTNSRWGQVVGNIVSEWTEILGLVWMTKILMEVGSKESGAVKAGPEVSGEGYAEADLAWATYRPTSLLVGNRGHCTV